MSGNKEIVDLPLISDPSNGDIYVVKSDTDYRIRIGAVNGLPYLDGTGKVPSSLLPTSTAGEANTASNVGDGAGTLYKQKSGVDLQFKTLKAGAGITLTNNVSDVTIDSTASGAGEANTASNVGTGTGLIYKQKSGVDLELKSIKAGTGVTVTNNVSDITITAAGSVASVSAGNGLNFSTITSTGSVTLGTPSSITLVSTNSVGSTTHAHAFAPGGTTGQYIRGDGTLATFPTSVTAVSAGNGMSFTTITGTGSVTMGTPSTVTGSTTNSASSGTHTHALTVTKNDVGIYVQSGDPGAVADGSLWIW